MISVTSYLDVKTYNFKVDETTIVIMKGLPVLQCENCSEYLLDDFVMKRMEEILDKVNSSAELEIIRYAA